MVLKASINGPNRRRNRVGDRTVASSTFTDVHRRSQKVNADNTGCDDDNSNRSVTDTISFRLRSLEKYLDGGGNDNGESRTGRKGISTQLVLPPVKMRTAIVRRRCALLLVFTTPCYSTSTTFPFLS